MSYPRILKMRRRVEALEDRLEPRLRARRNKDAIEALRRLTFDERRWLLALMKEHGSGNPTDLQCCDLSTDEQAGLHRLMSTMNDPTAPPGQLREERSQLSHWLDEFEEEVVRPEFLQHALIVQRRAEQFVESYGNSKWPEDKVIVDRCLAFLKRQAPRG